ncbi:MAG: MFS transporter [Deltaproteobacteria bacterium]|nr:MFS transporter [Deltaproteobacteria bacterium]
MSWSRWHRRVVLALGITWALDGLEASLVSNLGPMLQDSRTLGLTATQVGLASTVYLVGQVIGALVFGHLTDRAGRKRLFFVTLGLYLVATALSGFAPSFAVFLVFRFFAGAGIGGEYSAINSAIDELIPASLRGRVNLGINGSYWVGVVLGALLTVLLFTESRIPVEIGWRVAFVLGAVLGLAILFVRRTIPESPRWLLMHGREAEAGAVVSRIEEAVYGSRERVPEVAHERTALPASVSLRELLPLLIGKYRRRAILGVALMVAQTFFYNAIFFSYGLILERFHSVPPEKVGLYVIPFAVGNFVGPLILGASFDRIGRRTMIPVTYAASGLSLLLTGLLFVTGSLNAVTQTLAWCVAFFFASSAASSAYLTVSELFPVHVRGVSIAIFYAGATLVGAAAPSLFGRIVQNGRPVELFAGYAFAAALMLGAAAVARKLGVASEGKSLEELAID